MNFYDMKLDDSFWNSKISCQVVRVPGGWVLQSCDNECKYISAMTFVPFNNEFIETAETKVENSNVTKQSVPYFCTCISGRDKPKIIVTVCPECNGMLW